MSDRSSRLTDAQRAALDAFIAAGGDAGANRPAKLSEVGGGGTLYADFETPTGSVNGTTGSDGNAAFVFAHTPSGLLLMVDGVVQVPGVHYNLAVATATFVSGFIPTSGAIVRGSYRY